MADELCALVPARRRSQMALRMDREDSLRSVPFDLRPGDDLALIMEGDAESIAVKKLALEGLSPCAGIAGLMARFRVRPDSDMGDLEIADHLCKGLLAEPIFRECTLRDAGRLQPVRDAGPHATGTVEVQVREGVVTLDGEVPSLANKRIAGVLAWWVPGSRDVVNGLAVEPPEDDSDNDIADVVSLVLEIDPFLDASQIGVSTKDRRVCLKGRVGSATEREMAEFDAWTVLGVDRVENQIVVVW